MLRFVCVVLISLSAVACTKSKKDEGTGSAKPTTNAGSGSAVAADASIEIDAASAEGSAASAGSGAGSGTGTGTGSGSGSAGSGASAAAFDFDKLSHEDQVKFMKTKVMPPMKAAFQKFDPKDYAKFSCKTCHGKDPQKTKYKMPNPELKPLDFEAIKAGKEDKKMIEFMSKTVKPEMAKILQQPEMTETQPDGFGCLECHTQKKKK